MDRKCSDREMKDILQQNIEASPVVEKKIQEAYAYIRAQAVSAEPSNKVLPAKAAPVSGKRNKVRWLLPIAAACALLASVATAAAFGGFFTHKREQKTDKLYYEVDVNYDLLPYRMEVAPGYLPEGYKAPPGENLKFCKDDSRQNGISLCVVSADYLGMDEDALFVDNVKSVEETEINGMRADLITINYDKERVTRTFDKRIYLFNPREGYVGIVYGGNDLSMEELTKVAENLIFTKTDEQVRPVDFKELKREQKAQAKYEREIKEWVRKKYEDGLPKEQIYKKGEAFLWGGDNPYEITVLEASVRDSISGLSKDGFHEYAAVAGRMNENGELKPYDRVTYRGWSLHYGISEAEEISRETVGQKILTVKIQAVNKSDETGDYWAGAPTLQNLKVEPDGRYLYEDTYTEALHVQEYGIAEPEFPIYFDSSLYEVSDSHFYFRELAPGEALTYTLAYIVDEDKIGNLYLNFGGGIASDPKSGDIFERYVNLL